jgi:predicted dehydrogenase
MLITFVNSNCSYHSFFDEIPLISLVFHIDICNRITYPRITYNTTGDTYMGISLGLVGLGSFGSAFAELFKRHPSVDRIGLCDREPDRIDVFAKRDSFQDKFKPEDTYASLDEICQANFDALVIITQPWLHAPQAIQAMETGKHVYSAVPVIYLPDGDEMLDWCDKLISTCSKTGMHYMLGETTFYRPDAMYCRRQAKAGAFGNFVHAEGDYLHDVDSPTSNLREVRKRRLDSSAGREWAEISKGYKRRGIIDGPMHYPTHSTSGPMSTMQAHATKVSALAYSEPIPDDHFGGAPSCETAQFRMSNGASCTIREYRTIGHQNSEAFRIFGTKGCYRDDLWCDKEKTTPVTIEQMRDPLPSEVVEAFSGGGNSAYYGGHGGSHAYLVHEFVDAIANDRTPAVNAWEAVRYMAAGISAHKSAMDEGALLDVPDWGDCPE